MRRFIYLLAIVSLALCITIIASAQDGETSITDMLPITEDVNYQVGTGDTLDDIAALFDISLSCLIETNEIENGNSIQGGQVFLMSASCPNYDGSGFVAFPRPPADDGSGGGESSYVVRYGDTLDEIAFAFNVSVISLTEFNDIENPLDLRPGQILQIPADAPPYGEFPPPEDVNLDPEQGGGAGFDEPGETYVIQPGDTLDVIGATYDADPACIAQVNSISQPELIMPRMVIFIADSCPPYPTTSVIAGRIIPLSDDLNTPLSTVVFETVAAPTEVEQEAASPTPEIIATEAPTIAPPTATLVPTEAAATATVFVTPTLVPTIEQIMTEEVTEEATIEVVDVTPTLDSSVIVNSPTPEVLDTGGGEGGGGSALGNLVDTLRGFTLPDETN